MIKIFIIDDSMVVRNAFIKLFKDEKEIKIIGEAANPIDAFEIFKKVGLPDLFILDIEMPKMDGLTFLKQINEQKPTPVLICSTLVSKGSSAAIDALRLGAVDIVLKPKVGLKEFFDEYKENLIGLVKIAARSKLKHKIVPVPKIKKELSSKSIDVSNPSKYIVAIGSSTGGVQAIEEIVTNLQPQHPGIVIAQHMPEGFTASFASRLNAIVPNSTVVEAKEGEMITDSKVIIARGGIHMEVIEEDGVYKVSLKDFEKVNSHKPSVNVLFESICKIAQKNVTAFILTGMGDDGASGIKKLKELGNKTYGQNEKTSVVYGMPKAAKLLGGLEKELSIYEITQAINITGRQNGN